MTEKEFEKVVTERCSKIESTLAIKGREYRRGCNPFHNFEVGADISASNPTRVLDGFMLKHIISYRDMLNDIEMGNLPTVEYVDEKIGDIINYFILQEALIKKQIKEQWVLSL
jgi:hypothetical protein